MQDSSIAYGLKVEVRPGTADCRLEVWAGDLLIDHMHGDRDSVLARAKCWFGDGGCGPEELSPEEESYEEMSEMARWFAFEAPDDY